MKTIALLPMKKNSERVPNKNVRLLGDKPLFCHIADSIMESGIFDALCINTDSMEIADIAKKRYSKDILIIHGRPPSLCGDLVPMNEVLAYDVDVLGTENYYFQTHSTNPFITKETIISAYEEFVEGVHSGKDSLFSVTQHQARFFNSDFQPINHDPNILIRTQDLPPIFEENSCLYFFTHDAFVASRSRIGRRPCHFVTKAGDVEFTDIDTEEQWMLASSIVVSRSKEIM